MVKARAQRVSEEMLLRQARLFILFVRAVIFLREARSVVLWMTIDGNEIMMDPTPPSYNCHHY